MTHDDQLLELAAALAEQRQATKDMAEERDAWMRSAEGRLKTVHRLISEKQEVERELADTRHRLRRAEQLLEIAADDLEIAVADLGRARDKLGFRDAALEIAAADLEQTRDKLEKAESQLIKLMNQDEWHYEFTS